MPFEQDVKVNAELEYVIVKKNSESRKSASIELRVSTSSVFAKKGGSQVQTLPPETKEKI